MFRPLALLLVTSTAMAAAALAVVATPSFTFTTVVGFSGMLRHSWAPIFFEVRLVLLHFLLSLALLLRVVGVPHGLAVMVDFGQILSELLAFAALCIKLEPVTLHPRLTWCIEVIVYNGD